MDKVLKYLAVLTGVTCVAIGLYHVVGGPETVFGGGEVNASTDSQERFFAGLFAVYGVAWIWVARLSPIPGIAIRLLAAGLLAGGLGRVVSLIDSGQPHPFWIAMLVVEIAVPALFFAIAGADEKAR
ncbi:DUF4345 domain-containing protein [Mycobacteroides immunogenum]|uniref:DUF4345 domain-containing protein n=1 Tax=Mycobacteroides immunogenum TaxID=83262 RepID=A0A7V8LMB2_9MYCO|nr:DUF4345 domain-containing protein [Mycobacteroides immunogenum]AMT71093.1 hypothetical protein ABG82_12980 [Mycobacteroides immunogenum]ANO04200.1 hypothetical protein BAB75_13175 [Mycobacteroides immunogenum]KIU39094.1 hypothetical protein TL11_18610 [Mycobacteroides immunogenum]KPG04983.1 hypothetical protein AN909_21690 [Mycobacteroides immunogenum]KPG06764.1 hypothetical protein AN910_21755 [Mycobacteroides immunogenum]